MKAGKYTLKEFFFNRNIQQVVIPEIQRDYVWGKDQVTGLLDSILDDYEKFKDFHVKEFLDSELLDREIRNDFEEFIKRRNCSSNVGFIYAYSDEELPGRYFLIDGQQRFTTLQLMLLALVGLDEANLRERYQRTYLHNGQLKLSYKVRESAQDFMTHFVDFELSVDKQGDFEDQLWFLDDFSHDVTIQSISKMYRSIQKLITDAKLDYKAFYDYLENYTEFWYFDTNVSEQGEELYIYMNARGEQTQGNENIKADLLGQIKDDDKKRKIEEKNKYGLIWEQWQDYFWKNRAKGVKKGNENADKGFNEFLSCISGLERYLATNTTKPAEPYSVQLKVVVGMLNLKRIKSYIQALKRFEKLNEQVTEFYPDSSWYLKAVNLMWSLINIGNTNWWADYNDPNRGFEQNRMVFVWAIVHFFESTQLGPVDQIRFVRRTYLKYHNYDRAVGRIKQDVVAYQSSGFDEIEEHSKEYILKENFLKRFDKNCAKQRQAEQAIWAIEDHPLNLRGRDLGGTNISHLIDLSSEDVSVNQLEVVRDRFYELFPLDGNKGFFCPKLVHALLQYGAFWHRVSPWYYNNYEFDDWGRTIRGKGNCSKENHFRTLFNDLLESGTKASTFLETKQGMEVEAVENNECTALLWYSTKLGKAMWEQGAYIAFKGEADAIFPDVSTLINTKGNFKGGNPCTLSTLLANEE